MKFHDSRIDGEFTILTTIQCQKRMGGCGSRQEIKVKTADVERYNKGLLIQQAFPYLTEGQCERLISGYCSNCWDKLFSDPEDLPIHPGEQGKQEGF